MKTALFRYLPAFKVAAEMGNMRSAALLLHVTPSAISQQNANLEGQLGFILFKRDGRKVVLNEAGVLLLRRVQAALNEIEAGVQEAATVANAQAETVIRISVVPSFAQRWLLPRIGRWRASYPGIGIKIDATQRTIDLAHEGLHAGIRAGVGVWPGLVSERLSHVDAPLVLVGCPGAALRLSGKGAAAVANESLLGDLQLWQAWFARAGFDTEVKPAASFADSGLMLQAAEQDIGLVLARGVYIVDSLRDGRLMRLSDVKLPLPRPQSFFFVYPPGLKDWPPLRALSNWLQQEILESERLLAETGMLTPA